MAAQSPLASLRLRLLAAGFAALAAACAPGIGDECQTSADCSQNGERLCDITQRGGYCTIFNCEPDSCPDDSVCIVFGADVSTAPGCAGQGDLSRYNRSFCMASCGSNSDCRGGYVCTDLGRPDDPWGAIVAGKGSGKVCMEPLTAAPIPSDRATGVCAPGTSEDATLDETAETGEPGAEG
ncbi:MAG TPA: hypothetical protein VIM73_00060 [Polyangiaceae bacterium]